MLIVALLLLLTTSAAACAQQPSAPVMFRGDAAHTGFYASEGGVITGMQWRFQTTGDVTATPAVSGDVVYIGSGDGRMYALDRMTGRPRWTFDAGAPIQSSAAVAEGLVFFGTRAGALLALDARNGTLRWRVQTGATMALPWGHESGDVWTGSPVYADGALMFGAGDGAVYAVAPQTGEVRWKAHTGGRIRTAPAVADGRVFTGSFDGRVYAFDARTGGALWSHETAGAALQSERFGFDRRSIQSSPAVADGTVFVGARDGFIYALDAATGAQRWTVDHEISWINSSPAVVDNVVYAGSSDAHFLQALDARTGKEQWRAKSTGVVWSSPAVTRRHVYWGEGNGTVHVTDRSSGVDVSTFRTGAQVHGSPVVDGDMLFIGSADGGVYALALGAAARATARAVFFDSTYERVASTANAREVATYLAARGYTTVDARTVVSFMEQRISDRAPSVVVFAIDAIPAAAVAGPPASSIFRGYLDSGGKVVWTGLPPLIWPVEPLAGERGGLNELVWSAPEALLGVPHTGGIFDQRGVRATADGERWGVSARWRSGWGIDTAGVSTVLGLDDWGLAAAWVRRYGGPDGTGFVRLPADNPAVIYFAAEYRPQSSSR